jgi:outer membrane immunogenic protein
MKKFLLSAIALATLTASALAADLPSRKAAPAYVPPPPPPPMWTGFYAGLNIGGGWDAGNGNGNAWNLLGQNGGVTNGMSGGVIGGGQVGYNYQLNGLGGGMGGGMGGGTGGLGGMGLLIGAEADFQGTSMGSNGNGANYYWFGNYGDRTGVSVPWFGTVRGRLGLTVMPTLLLYGTGGFAYADVQRNGGLFGWNNNSATQTGWTAGGGAEWMFMPNWSIKAEYLYTDVSGGNSNYWGGNWGASINNVNNHTRWNTVRAGVNYHFNWGAAPVAARY